MDGPLPRRCGTCRFHQAGSTPCSGRCQHPRLQPPIDCMRPLMRERELHCYRGWGRDFWEPKASVAWERDGNDGGHRLTLDQSDPQSFDSQSQWQSATGRPRPFVLIHEDDWN